MSDLSLPEKSWMEWFEVQKRARQLWSAGALPAAIAELDAYLDREPHMEIKRQAIAFRGSLHEARGDLESARGDILAAHRLSGGTDYERYTLELSLGSMGERLGEAEHAAFWYLEALATAAADPSTSGGASLLRLLKCRSETQLTNQQRELCERVALQSWALLGLGGRPDLRDLLTVAKQLLDRQQAKRAGR